MGIWKTSDHEHSEAIDEESYDDWVRNTRERALGEGSERLDHEDLDAADPSYRDRPLREFRERFPDEYMEPWETSKPIEAFRHPEQFAGEINPKYPQALLEPPVEYEVNCCDCARAVERTWRGQPEAAAGLRATGEPRDRMELWAGERYRPVDVRDIRERLEAAGHGSSGIVSGVFRSPDGTLGGHSFNVVNDGGEVKAVDGQVGMVEPWNDQTGHPYIPHAWDGGGGRGKLMAMGWDGRGRSLW